MFKSIVNSALVVAALVLAARPLFAQTFPPATPAQEAKLIAVLKSDAPQKEKIDACRQLAVVGTKEAVPALAAMLGDENLAHMARYGLEPIADPSVDAALRDALGKLQGRLLAGVVGSLGVRRDAKAVEPLAKLLQNSDTMVVEAAARALGRIGTLEAANSLESALPKTAAAARLAVCEGLFRAAEALSANDHRNEAVAIYDRLRKLDPAPQHVRVGALRGAILARGNDGLALLREQLHGGDYLLFAAAVRVAQELPGDDVTQALAADLGKLHADRQIVVLETLGQRAKADTLPAILALAKAGTATVRVAAIRAATATGNASIAPVLTAMLGDADQDVARAAQENLAALPGAEVDAAVMAMFAGSDPPQRLKALELIGLRRMTAAVPALLKAASDGDAPVRSAALRRVGELGGPKELAAVLDLLAGPASEGRGAAEQAAAALASKADQPEESTAQIADRLAGAQPAQKVSLLRVLATVGGANALKAVRAALADPEAEVHAAAVRALGTWKTAEVVPDLLALAQNAANPTDKTLGLSGYLAWAAKEEVAADQRLAMCRQAAGIVREVEQKKLLLAAASTIASPEAIAIAEPYLGDTSIRDEACAALVSVAETLLKGRNARQVAGKLVGPLEKASAVAPAGLADRVKAALEEAKSKSQ
ncbi:MAG: HEAT repeat domain-containing protein [Pirellulales bacterium]